LSGKITENKEGEGIVTVAENGEATGRSAVLNGFWVVSQKLLKQLKKFLRVRGHRAEAAVLMKRCVSPPGATEAAGLMKM
jgi:hypothetical protein